MKIAKKPIIIKLQANKIPSQKIALAEVVARTAYLGSANVV
jgi:hypothetical protein